MVAILQMVIDFPKFHEGLVAILILLKSRQQLIQRNQKEDQFEKLIEIKLKLSRQLTRNEVDHYHQLQRLYHQRALIVPNQVLGNSNKLKLKRIKRHSGLEIKTMKRQQPYKTSSSLIMLFLHLTLHQG